MDCTQSCQTHRAVMGITLCLFLVAAFPVSSTMLGEMDPPSDLVPFENDLTLLRFIRSVIAYNKLKDSVGTDLAPAQTLKTSTEKRGFGIAGLDNVDMITSILDRSRSRSRSRPQMSSSLNLNQLRALMAKAG